MRSDMDPVEIDQDHPPSLEHMEIFSGDSMMFGAFFKAQGSGKKATILLLHGFPGHERNFDIAHSLRRAGFNVMVFHYRGSWGSGGVFSFSNMLKDTRAAMDHLRENSEELLIDIDTIIPIGHSMGGWEALMCASEDERIPAVGSLAGFNLGLVPLLAKENTSVKEMTIEKFKELIRPMRSLSPEELLAEVVEAGEEWNILEKAEELSKKKLLVIGAKRDPLSIPQYHFHPLVDKLGSLAKDDLNTMLLDCDHNFSSCRISLSSKVCQWVEEIMK